MVSGKSAIKRANQGGAVLSVISWKIQKHFEGSVLPLTENFKGFLDIFKLHVMGNDG